MSSGDGNRSTQFLGMLLGIAVSAFLCWLAWWAWNELPRLRAVRRSEFGDFSYVLALLAIFAALSLINPVLRWLYERFFADSDH